MMRMIVILFFLLFSWAVSASASTIKPIEKIGDGISEMYYGVVEIPDNIDKTKTKGTPVSKDCTYKTNDDVGRGIARFVVGLVKVATFWCPESENASSGSPEQASVK